MAQAENKALPESGGNLLSAEYQQIMECWFRTVTARQREFVTSKPLVEIKSPQRRKSQQTAASAQSITA
jgi:hypothetical protein